MQRGHQDVNFFLEDYQMADTRKAPLKSPPSETLCLKNFAFVARNEIWL